MLILDFKMPLGKLKLGTFLVLTVSHEAVLVIMKVKISGDLGSVLWPVLILDVVLSQMLPEILH